MIIGNSTNGKELNRSVLLRLIKEKGSVSRASLSVITGLNKSTISNLTGEMIAEGLILETGHGESAIGRKPVYLALNPNGLLAGGILIGNGNLTVLISNVAGNILVKEVLPFDPQQNLELILASGVKILKARINTEPSYQLSGVGVGIAGIIDVAEGWVKLTPNLKSDIINVKEIMGPEFGVEKVMVDNDINAMIVGKMWFGAARGYRDVICVGVEDNGIGSSLVIQSRLHRGINGVAGEIGHTVLDCNGPVCSCGNRGCLEALYRKALGSVMARIDSAAASELSRLYRAGESYIPRLLDQAVRQGDCEAKAIIQELGEIVGLGLGNAINLLTRRLLLSGVEWSITVNGSLRWPPRLLMRLL